MTQGSKTGTTPCAGSDGHDPVGPRGAGYTQPALVSVAFLVFSTADAFSLPFLPIYAEQLFRPGGVLSLDFARGLPITAFWLAVAAAQLSTGRWERGRNRRFLFLAAVALAAAGLAIAATATTLPHLVLGRSVSGFGYGMVLILAQDYLLRALGPKARTLASGLYLGLFFGGYVFGALAGGALADATGFAWTLWTASALTVASGLLLLALKGHVEAQAPQPLRLRVMMRNRALLALVLFAAVPSRIVNGGFLYLLAPLYLHAQGHDQSATGQVIMVFSIVMAVTAVPWARLVDWSGRPLLFTLAGLAVTGAAMLVLPAGLPGLWGMVVAMLLLGTGQAIGMSPQITMLFRLAAPEIERFGQTGILGFYRVCERVGLMAGPLLTSWMLEATDTRTTLCALGAMALLCSGILAVCLRLMKPAPCPADRSPS